MPRGVEVPAKKKQTGADFDTEWARTPVARAARGLIVAGPLKGLVKLVADPEIVGLDRLADLRAAATTTTARRRRRSSPPTTPATSTPR